MSFDSALKRWKLTKGMTVPEIMNLFKCSESSVWKWLRGVPMSRPNAMKISQITGIKMAVLMGATEDI